MPDRFELKPGSGTLFNHSSKLSERSPDMGGELRLDADYKAGTTIRLSAWKRANGNISIGIKHPRPVS